MQVRLFTISVASKDSEEEVNRFLRGHRILEMDKHLVQSDGAAYWCFCITYLEGASKHTRESKRKVKTDYRQILNEASFQRFMRLRTVRKKIAQEEGLPAFAIFTDEQMAALARCEHLSIAEIKKIKGIGEKKAARFGEDVLKLIADTGFEADR